MVKEILRCAEAYRKQVIFVSSYAHLRKEKFPSFVEYVLVDANKEEADLAIINKSGKGDLAVTDDLGLSGILLAKGVYVLTSRGKLLTNEEMDFLLDVRYQSAKQRRSGLRTKGPKKLTQDNQSNFQKQLEKILSNQQEF
ncbi:hypothetical protein SAMN05421736_102174 [Evansella caseinilytica]|uniref:Uncharacterized protein n=1 Tax=Evansella caseinilytica TaxID=1503961 RepID=A0A1H3KLC9_9BACI|nr:hypothetical protein SAMN05421736_102174 [Evansella caseinilytica]